MKTKRVLLLDGFARDQSPTEEEQFLGRREGKRMVGCTRRYKDKEKIKINQRVNRWFGAPEEMEVERREEVEEEGGELVQAVEHLKRYIIYQSMYQSSFIKDCERP